MDSEVILKLPVIGVLSPTKQIGSLLQHAKSESPAKPTSFSAAITPRRPLHGPSKSPHANKKGSASKPDALFDMSTQVIHCLFGLITQLAPTYASTIHCHSSCI